MIISTTHQAAVPQWEDGTETDEAELREWPVEPAWHGQRLDKAMSVLCPEFSRSYLQQLIAASELRIDGRVQTKVSTRLVAGQRLTLRLVPTPQAQAFTAQPGIEFGVLFEDEHLMVVDKPAGLVVHPAAGHWQDTLLNGLLARDPCFAALPRAGIVHRLDKDTSGVMVVAKSRPCMDALVQAIAARDVKREYLAIAHGLWAEGHACVCEVPIGRDPRNRLRMAALPQPSGGAKPAWTEFVCLRSGAMAPDLPHETSLVHARLGTGRTHQIRVHMAWLGHPLLGDSLYGGQKHAGMQRQALHAWRLGLRHPVTAREMRFEATWPDDFRQTCERAGWDTIAVTAN